MKKRKIDYALVATSLYRCYNRQYTKISVSTFRKAFEKILNAAEVDRLFAYFTDIEQILVPINKRYFKWIDNIHADHFKDDFGPKVDYIKRIFENYDIQSTFGRTQHEHPVNRVKHPRKQRVDLEVVKEPVAIQDDSEKVFDHSTQQTIEDHIKALYALGVSEITLTFRRPEK